MVPGRSYRVLPKGCSVPAKMLSESSSTDGTALPSLLRLAKGAPSVIDLFGPGRSKTRNVPSGDPFSSRIFPDDFRRLKGSFIGIAAGARDTLVTWVRSGGMSMRRSASFNCKPLSLIRFGRSWGESFGGLTCQLWDGRSVQQKGARSARWSARGCNKEIRGSSGEKKLGVSHTEASGTETSEQTLSGGSPSRIHPSGFYDQRQLTGVKLREFRRGWEKKNECKSR